MDPLDTRLIERTLEWMQFDCVFHDQKIKQFVEDAYRKCVPLEFYLQPASTSGKYHPLYTLGVGGLVRHTKAAMIMANTLFSLEELSPRREDIIMAALALHDVAKPSKTHPVEVEPLLEPIRDEYYGIIQEVMPLIKAHMGQWDLFGKLPKPRNYTQRFVHQCDYLASRRFLAVDLMEYPNPIKKED